MLPGMARRREFTTAASRRRLEPVVWVIDGEEIHVRADLILTDLAQLADVLSTAGSKLTDEDKQDTMKVFLATQELVDAIVANVAPLVVEADRDTWRRLARALDPQDLVGLVYDLVEEVTGKNPTLPSGSSTLSPPSGTPSTAGAQPEASTPSTSPSTES